MPLHLRLEIQRPDRMNANPGDKGAHKMHNAGQMIVDPVQNSVGDQAFHSALRSQMPTGSLLIRTDGCRMMRDGRTCYTAFRVCGN